MFAVNPVALDPTPFNPKSYNHDVETLKHETRDSIEHDRRLAARDPSVTNSQDDDHDDGDGDDES